MLKSVLLTTLPLLSGATAVAVSPHGHGGSPHQDPPTAEWPNGPFATSGRWIHDASNNTVNYAGTNWPGHGEVMIPEGLQYQSIEYIVSQVKSIGMNVFRLTFAIEMVDQIYENGGEDVDLRTAFVRGLGEEEGLRVLGMVLERNPEFTEETKRLEVYDAVVAEANRQEIYIHLDNHMSRGMWCCSETDGNAWWGDTDFDTDNWVRGLAYMADHGKRWHNLMSLSLRNEPRDPKSSPAAQQTYNWRDWYTFIRLGASAVNTANPSLLIFLSGLNYDTYIEPVFQGAPLSPSTDVYFSRDDFPGYGDKLVLEIHNYETGIESCGSLRYNLYRKGFAAMHEDDEQTKMVFPVMLTEFGFAMDGSTWQGVYATCLAEYVVEERAGWTIWVLVGSYYTRSGTDDYDETWGLLSHDWSGWRDEGYVENQARGMVRGSLDWLQVEGGVLV